MFHYEKDLRDVFLKAFWKARCSFDVTSVVYYQFSWNRPEFHLTTTLPSEFCYHVPSRRITIFIQATKWLSTWLYTKTNIHLHLQHMIHMYRLPIFYFAEVGRVFLREKKKKSHFTTLFWELSSLKRKHEFLISPLVSEGWYVDKMLLRSGEDVTFLCLRQVWNG